jgi:hypothetical protein
VPHQVGSVRPAGVVSFAGGGCIRLGGIAEVTFTSDSLLDARLRQIIARANVA